MCLELLSTDGQQSGNMALPDKYLLGILVTVVDEVASDFVYGPIGTAGRPGGLRTISIVDKLHSAKLLTVACQGRWLAFLDLWQTAGWDPSSIVEFADTLRPLQYRNDLDEGFIQSVAKDYPYTYIADLSTKQGFAW